MYSIGPRSYQSLFEKKKRLAPCSPIDHPYMDCFFPPKSLCGAKAIGHIDSQKSKRKYCPAPSRSVKQKGASINC
jgi:hypothetical protein